METSSNMPGSMNPVPSPTNPGNQGAPRGFMETLEYYLVTKAPFQIPANVKEMIVKFGPWLDALFLLISIPLVLALIGLNTVLSIYPRTYMASGWSIFSIFSLITFVLSVIALPGLFRRKLSGWNMIFYASIISLVSNVFSGNIVGGIIGAIIGLYILFQIRSYYN